MNVAAIMTRKPVTIRNSATLRQALDKMREANCRHLPVVSGENHLIGIISDRDCRVALNSPQPLDDQIIDSTLLDTTRVGTVMTPAPIIVEPDMSAAEAARLMLANRISALPVMRGETLIGIITTSDILVAFMVQSRKPYQH